MELSTLKPLLTSLLLALLGVGLAWRKKRGGLLPEAPEYGEPQPSSATAARLRYGVWRCRTMA